jgi:hypothetical protein
MLATFLTDEDEAEPESMAPGDRITSTWRILAIQAPNALAIAHRQEIVHLKMGLRKHKCS